MFANKHAKILIALVCAVLGFMLATQFKKNEMNYLKKWKSCRQKQVTRLLPEK